MRRFLLFLLLFLATACASKRPDAPEPVRVPYKMIAPVVERVSLTNVERWGYEIYLRDIAASRGTDAAQIVTDLSKSGSLGWIVVPYESGLLVRFIDRDERSVIDVSVDPYSTLTPFVVENRPPKDLTPREASMWRARQLAASQPYPACSDRYNSVVIPESDDPDSDWLVYLLAATVDPTVIMLGGHQKFRVDSLLFHLRIGELKNHCAGTHFHTWFNQNFFQTAFGRSRDPAGKLWHKRAVASYLTHEWAALDCVNNCG